MKRIGKKEENEEMKIYKSRINSENKTTGYLLINFNNLLNVSQSLTIYHIMLSNNRQIIDNKFKTNFYL